MNKNRIFILILILVFTFTGVVLIKDRVLMASSESNNIKQKEKEKEYNIEEKPAPIKLETVGTKDKFYEVVEKYDNTKESLFEKIFNITSGAKNSIVTADSNYGSKEDKAASSDYSKTNVQVEGVDEADIVKIDGENIYYVTNKRIMIIKAQPTDNMELLASIDFSKENLNILELYLEDSKLIVLTSGWKENLQRNLGYVQETTDNKVANYTYGSDVYVKALIYDITNKKNPKLLKEASCEGDYISTRKIGSYVYLITNKDVDFGIWHKKSDEVLPYYSDSSLGLEIKRKTFKEIKCFPEIYEPDFLNIMSIDTSDVTKPANMQSFLGSGRNIYASENYLYVTSSSWSNNTKIMKFAFDKASVYPFAMGEVNGYPINQFSMDENNGFFRIATNYGKANGMYVLDYDLTLKGKIEDIAPTERIYSVRFMDDRAYMVTFKNTDPLFAIDLKDPGNPQILGQLKIPGFSNYLHPYDENHIIGFGKDTIEIERKDINGKSTGVTTAYTLGMKISVFDVTDMANPKEEFVERIGDRGTDSVLLQNHKALLFNKEKGLIAFPININEVSESSKIDKYGIPKYGAPSFQGAFVYSFNLDSGFRLAGKITHMTNEDILKTGYTWKDSSNIDRIIYIGDTLYTLSKGMVKASEMDDTKELGSLNLTID